MSALDTALARFGPLVDDRTGIIRSVRLVKATPDDPAVFTAYAEPCDTVPLAGIAAANRGAACSPSRDRALVRACGESIERYCSAFVDDDQCVLASAADLTAAGQRYVPVDALYPFGPAALLAGFPYQPVGDKAIRWVRGTSAITGDPVLVPASCVYVPYLFDSKVEPFTHMPISTGLAASWSVPSAIDKGALEILERDALMTVWYQRIPVPRIDPASCRGRSAAIDTMLDAQVPGGPTWHLSLLTLDVAVPIIAACLVDPAGPPRTSFGIAADPDPVRAMQLALEEAALTRVLLNQGALAQIDGEPVTDGVRTLRDHLYIHAASRTLRSRLGFLLDDGPLLDLAVVQARFSSTPPLLERLAGAAFEVVYVDITTDDVADAGLRVVRTVIPGTQPLDNDHRYRYLGGRRLRDVPADRLNPDPHPFP